MIRSLFLQKQCLDSLQNLYNQLIQLKLRAAFIYLQINNPHWPDGQWGLQFSFGFIRLFRQGRISFRFHLAFQAFYDPQQERWQINTDVHHVFQN